MKRYKTNRGNLNSVIRVAGESIRIKFVAGSGGVGYFETNDTSLQQAIEQDADFGVKFVQFLKAHGFAGRIYIIHHSSFHFFILLLNA